MKTNTPKTIRSDYPDAELSAAVAQAAGYSDFGYSAVSLIHDRRVMWCEESQKHIPMPPYATSLDAIVPVVEALPQAERPDYIVSLLDILKISSDEDEWMNNRQFWQLVNATPRQRCVAYLKASGWNVTDK